MLRLVRDFPEARTCPADTLRRLRVVDPTTEVLYLGPSERGGRWMLGTVRPDQRLRDSAFRTIEKLKEIPRPRRGIRWHRRYWLAVARYQGFRPVAPYECVEPDGQMVADYIRADWLHRHTTENEFFQQIDNERAAVQAANERDLADPGRAREAWKYAFTKSHMPSAAIQSAPRVSSAVTAHQTVPSLPSVA